MKLIGAWFSLLVLLPAVCAFSDELPKPIQGGESLFRISASFVRDYAKPTLKNALAAAQSHEDCDALMRKTFYMFKYAGNPDLVRLTHLGPIDAQLPSELRRSVQQFNSLPDEVLEIVNLEVREVGLGNPEVDARRSAGLPVKTKTVAVLEADRHLKKIDDLAGVAYSNLYHFCKQLNWSSWKP